MLGEKVGEFTGKNTGRRVISNGDQLKMEISVEQKGSLYGLDAVDYGTYEALMVGNHLEGKGQGLMMTANGDTISWTATGVGNFTGKGQSIHWRGSLTYHTQAQKLAKLNGTCFIFEHDIDESGNTSESRVYEWK